MGGFNSGRSGGRATLERTNSLRLDVNRLVRPLRRAPRGVEANFTWQWSRYDKPVVIAFTVQLDHPHNDAGTVRIRHGNIVHPTGSETGPQDYTVQLESWPCRLGGRRWWFRCPRTGRPCGKLYLPNGGYRFWSRDAYGLDYQVTRETPLDRAHRRIGRAYAKLGAQYRGPGRGFPERPKGMRRRTYERITAELMAAEESLEIAFVIGAERIIRRSGGKWPL